MTIYTLYVFDRLGTCLYWQQWHQQSAAAANALTTGVAISAADMKAQPTTQSAAATAAGTAVAKKKSAKAIEGEKKLMFGLLYSTKVFCKMIAPHKLDETEIEPFYSFATREYKLHYYETMTGLRFALTTDPGVSRQRETLQTLYTLYVECCSKNALYKPGASLQTVPAFVQRLNTFIESLPFFDKDVNV